MDNQIIIERITRIDEKQQSIVNQLDTDRRDIDQLRIDMGTIKDQLSTLINQFSDSKAETRQNIQDAITQELPKAVKREIRLLSTKHPRKTIKGRPSVLELIKNYFKK